MSLLRTFALLIFGVVTAGAQGLQLPAPVGYVNDFAHVIPATNAATINRIIDDVRAKSGGEIVVVTLPDLGGRPVEEVGLNLIRQWKIGGNGKPGDPARNTSVVILVVPKETSKDGRGHFRMELGNGSEGFITDAESGEIRDEMIPFFQRRDYGSGIELGTLRVAQKFADEFHFAVDSSFQAPVARRARGRSASGGGIPPVVWLILLFVILSMLGGGRGRRRGCIPIFLPMGGGWGGGGWGGGGFGGGGGWGGGGGGFGGFGGGGGASGGGSSGSW